MKWILSGTLILFAISYSMLSTNIPEPWNPMPIYLVIIAWMSGFFYMLLMPTIYIIWTPLVFRHNHYAELVFVAVLLVSFLDVLYFLSSWQYGIQYQGKHHTIATSSINFVGFGIAVFLALKAKLAKSMSLAYSANLLMFCMLSWQAFPYLGEMP